jgi:hypothetical protein
MDQGYGFIRSSARYSNPRWNNYCFNFANLHSESGSGLERDMPVEFQLTYDDFRSTKEGVPLYRAVNIRVLEAGIPTAI